jgi:hypothetical protein
MGNDQSHEKFFFGRDRQFYHIRRRIYHASQFRGTEKVFPDLAVIGGNGQEIGDPASFKKVKRQKSK